MKNEEQFIVEGYLFGHEDDVKQAKEEVGTIKFIEQKINYDDTATAFRIYEKAIKEKLFKTPIGFEFLRKMQGELTKRGVADEKIKPIRLYQVFSHHEEEKPVRIFQLKVKPDKSREYLRTSIWINVLLVILVIGMFLISLFGENTNMMNYRFKIENEYSIWEQELKERESRIREKERELNMEKEE